MSFHSNDTGLTAIRITGGILSSSILTSIRHYQLPGQDAQEYGVEKGLKLNDELGRYWRIAQARWKEFLGLSKREDIDPHDLTINHWLIPLLTKVFGFNLTESDPCLIGERTFPITHIAFDNQVPLVLTGFDHPMDSGHERYGVAGRKRSPAGLLQEYLNAETSCLWGIASNGKIIRLFRDNPAITRPAFIEIDLERLFEEDLYIDFTVCWLLLHATRFAPTREGVDHCFLELWRNQGQNDGERVLGELSHGVTNALRWLGTGFVIHPDNTGLRSAIQKGDVTKDQFFQELLRLVYRFIFLLTTEDREILLDPDAPVQNRLLYKEAYSISILRDRCRFKRHYDHHHDAWQQVLINFSGFAKGQPQLGQPALGGLFSKDQCPNIENAKIANHYLYKALFKLCFFEISGSLSRVNYRDMGTEEFGSVYESLLELIPKLSVEGQWRFEFYGDDEEESSNGHDRKLTGSYYTPDSLVQELINSALVPIIEKRLADNPDDPRKALLEISVCDPACGSGHFLLSASRRLAMELALIDAGTEQPTEMDFRHAIREVVCNCIYGIDSNPLAVELCRIALWLEAVEPGKPLGFLGAHIQIGNSLIGVLKNDVLEKGIPEGAFKLLSGDDQETIAALKYKNRQDTKQCDLFAKRSDEITVCYGEWSSMPEETLIQVEKKYEAWLSVIQSKACQAIKLSLNLYTAAFLAPKNVENFSEVPTNMELTAPIRGEAIPKPIITQANFLMSEYRVFHWQLSFPEIFDAGGFDVVLGNPPWEKIKLIEKEFFSALDAEISNAGNAAERSRLIRKLSSGEKEKRFIYEKYLRAKRMADVTNNFARQSGRYPLTGKGDINLYALFSELATQLVSKDGRIGIIVPSGIATDNTTKTFFDQILSSQRLHKLFEFENEGFFQGAGSGHMVRFALTTIGGASIKKKNVLLMFQGKRISDLNKEEKQFTLTAEEISLLNPNTKTCPIFQSKFDAELTKKIYKATPILIKESDEEDQEFNPWGIKFCSMFHMSNNSNLFKTKKNMLDENGIQEGNFWYLNGHYYLPLYEAKMMYIYNHRHGDFADAPLNERPHRLPTIEESKLKDIKYEVEPYYWVKEEDVLTRIGIKRKWVLGWRDITDSRASVRSVVCSIIPKYGASNKIPIFLPDDNISAKLITCLYANLASLPFDYVARQKLAGITLNYFIMKQLPVLSPSKFSELNQSYIIPRVLELTYTSNSLKPFAIDLGYHGDPFVFDLERRHQLKSELDAYYARLYGLSRDELRYVLDPADVMGADYPSESFRVLKNKEMSEFGEYRTQRLVLEAFDKLESSIFI